MHSTLGLGIGSVSVAHVLLDEVGRVIQLDYRTHNGNPSTCLSEMLMEAAIENCVGRRNHIEPFVCGPRDKI